MQQKVYKNNYNLHLSNSPQLELVCPQTRPNKLKEAKVINQRIMNQQVSENENKCMVQTKNIHEKYILTTILQRQHVNKTNPKYKNHTKHSKTKQPQS